jgi:4'-phosphopantetheinyl transferase
MARKIHIYCVDLDAADLDLGRLEASLSPDEAAQAARFRFARDRRRYVARHAVLRTLLAAYRGGRSGTPDFTLNAYGKPSLPDGPSFNMSHSHGTALIAIAPEGGEIGCDIERREPSFADEGIAERFFSPGEAATLCALPDDLATQAFFDCWTRKEAYVKARGLGLALALDSFEVELDPRRPAALHRGCDGWSLHSFEPAPHFHAAIVAEGEDWETIFHPPIHLRELLGDYAAV